MTDPFNPSPRLADRLEAAEKEVRTWGRVTRDVLIRRVALLNLRERATLADEKQLRKDIRSSTRTKDGGLEKVAFIFPRHGIFLEHGVGKNRPIGSIAARNAAKPWLKPVLPEATVGLAKILAEAYADVIAAELRILIPGVIDTTIK